MHNHGMFEIDPTDSLLLTGLGPIGHLSQPPLLGMRGIEVRKGSGQQGYFEVRIVHALSADGSSKSFIGLTINDVLLPVPGFRPRHWNDYNDWLGGDQPTYAWRHDGWIFTPDGFKGDNCALRFKTGDVVGLMVDCVEMPTLRFFLNGELVHQLGLLQEIYGSVLYPAFFLNFDQIHITSNPSLPIEF